MLIEDSAANRQDVTDEGTNMLLENPSSAEVMPSVYTNSSQSDVAIKISKREGKRKLEEESPSHGIVLRDSLEREAKRLDKGKDKASTSSEDGRKGEVMRVVATSELDIPAIYKDMPYEELARLA